MNSSPSKSELLHLAWDHLGVRLPRYLTCEQIHEVLQYKVPVETYAENKLNKMRNYIMAYIQGNEHKLSMPCNGDCYGHTDGVVLFCYRKLREEERNAKEQGNEKDAGGSGQAGTP